MHGNCSLSLAPLKAEHRPKLVGMFQQIEEMPDAAFDGAFEWTWEGFADYVDAMRGRIAVNVAPLVGHSVDPHVGDGRGRAEARRDARTRSAPCRTCCASASRPAPSASRPASSTWTRTSRRCRAASRTPTSSTRSRAVLGEFGRMLQVVPEFYNTDITIARVDQLAELSLKHDIPTTFSPLFDSPRAPDNVSRVLARVDEQVARGARVWPQVQTPPDRHQLQPRHGEPVLRRRCRCGT